MPSKQKKMRKMKKEQYQKRVAGGSVDDSMDGSMLEGGNVSFVDGGSKGERVSIVDDISDISLTDSIFSRSVSPNSISSISRRGRPKKRKNRGGRPKKVVLNENVSKDICNVNFVPDFLSVDLFDIPFGPVLHSDNRMINMNINVARDYIKEMWSDPNTWLQEDYIYSYLKYLTTRTEKHVVVLDPAYSFVDYQYGDRDPLIPIENCFNYSANYDILFIPICFPGHFGLVIYDRTVRDNPICLFVDSLPAVDRLLNVRYPGFDIRRVDLIKRAIIELTPNVNEDDIQIHPISRGDFVEQSDGVNCGFFVCLYTELYLFNNNSLKFPDLNIQYERKRILWNLSQLLLSNDIDYVRIFADNPRNAPVNENVFNFNLNFGDDIYDNCVVNDFPVLDLSPDPPLRRSARISARNVDSVPKIEDLDINENVFYKISATCRRKHKLFPCGDVRSLHFEPYYDSGNFGDEVCCFCNALLLKSEVNENYRKKYKRITSSFCCRCGAVSLPPFSPHPQLLIDLTNGASPISLEFLQHMNIYNTLLAFASVYVGHRESNLAGGICFMLNGEFVRKLSSISPGADGPSFSQLYILDANTAFENRINNVSYGGNRVNQNTLKNLDALLRESHPLATAYKNFHTQYLEKLQTDGLDSVKHYRLVLLSDRDAPVIIRDPSDHPRQVNLPTEETLFSICTEADELPQVKGIYITDLEGHLFTFAPNHPLTDTLCYPVLFPCGDDGYHSKIPVNKNNLTVNETSSDSEIEEDSDKKHISVRDYVKYRLAVRKNETYHNIWNSGGGLSQKYALDYNARVDSDIANYLRRDDMDLRGTYPPDALRWLQRDCGAKSVDELGHIVMFRKYHPGTRPYFQNMFYNATAIMARTRKTGFCSFMFTFTCNPRWPEIQRNLLRNNQKVVDRFDIICRIYEDKLRKVHYLLEKKHIFGNILGSGESREFQKRIGGPHLHRVFCTDIPATPENVENLIWAHIPPEPPANDKSVWANFLRKVRELLPLYQFHDCGAHCSNNRGKCKKGFPKKFSKITVLHENQPAEYKRPSPEDGGETLKIPRGSITIEYNNSHVVAYNPLILVMFHCHHNLEYAYGQSDNLKYALKYPFKGNSFSYVKSSVDGRIDVDEPAQYAKMIYRSPTEAYSRLMGYKYAFLSHTVIVLQIHLPDNQKLFFNSKTAPTVLANVEEGILPDTHLTAYWILWRKNINDPAIRNILFENLPESYSFDNKEKVWRKRRMAQIRKITKPIIGRILSVSPREPERFALYILTKHFPGDPDELKNVNGHVCTSFADAARLRGLFEDNGVWERTLREASFSLNPSQMRQLFANILVFGGTERCVIDGLFLWEMFMDQMYDRRRCSDAEKLLRIDRALAIIERYLLSNGRTMDEFSLPLPNNPLINDPDRALDAFFFPNNVNSDELDETLDTSALERANLNAEQNTFFNMIRNAVFDSNSVNKYFYLSGDGGTGKTFLLNYVLYQLRSLNLKVLPTASTGIASTKFYAGGMTFHSAFRFGINVEPGKLPLVRFDSFFGRRIIECNVIIIDEITMLNKTVFENVDLLCRSMVPQNKDHPFAGKVVILSGDWKQSLPVVNDSTSPVAQVAASIQSSHLYPLFQKFRLVQNMRVVPSEIQFKDWLYTIGTGTIGDVVNIPPNMIVNSRQELYDFVFDQGFTIASNELLKRLLLAPTNRVVDAINSEIIDMIDSPEHEYLSIDNPTSENPLVYNAADYDVAQLNRLTPIGMPAHSIKLKVGSVIVLLQNLNTQKSLCNGTRLIVTNLLSNLIEAETINIGSDHGIRVGICRTRNSYVDIHPDGVSFERFQFPVRVAFCMTITKAQGQTCDRLGIDFSDEPFAHGQLYTALSRARSSEFIRVFAPNKTRNNDGSIPIRNVVANGISFD